MDWMSQSSNEEDAAAGLIRTARLMQGGLL